jgi:hypothetical protein
MIDEHRHCYLHKGGSLLGSDLLQTLGKKLLNSAAEKASQKAGEYLGEVATKGLIKQLLPIVKKSKPASDAAFVNELLAY